ncbi:DNA/RNA helicase domain-containing protein [Kitasatospora sp. NPDC127067]|uniref:DNA/RNA helicase domain-containing protein n=1 Tax=Kitasatospora sp. NPDC127067 TaxID=3347126 RepID=UPI00365D6ED1
MYVHRGTIDDVARRAAQPDFVDACAARLRARHGTAPGAEEAGSWQRSWPVLLDALVRAGLGGLEVLLELSLPGTGERVDAAVVGQDTAGALTVVVLELKQWTVARPAPGHPGMLEVGRRTVPHPARQTGGYVHYLRDWADGGSGVQAKGTVVLHNAPADLIERLREMAPPGSPSAEFPLLGRDDLAAGVPAGELAERLGCAGLTPAPSGAVDRFIAGEHRPSERALERLAANIEGRRAFRLVGEQDRARRAILDAVREATAREPALGAAGERGPGGMVVVTGGPGTGKTVIAARLMGELCRMPRRNPRLLTPSGTLTRQLQRLLREESRGLVATFKGKTPGGLDKNSVVLLDEAHRAATYPHQRGSGFPVVLRNLLDRVGVLVLFLDERQIVRPTEGLTLDELARHARASGAAFRHVDLEAQFRCNGSQAYHHWVDLLFSPAGAARPWDGAGYDLAVAEDPDALAAWVDDHTARGRSARITAGFCWPWNADDVPPLEPEVAIRWHGPDHGERSWARPWNLRAEQPVPGFPDVPARPYWATDRGGHDQVGCIYTAQGLEYAFGAVILGGDLVRRDDRWQARPEASHDVRQLRTLPPEQYLRYALNTYRVLATRATHGTRLYSTDPETQAYLASLLTGS